MNIMAKDEVTTNESDKNIQVCSDDESAYVIKPLPFQYKSFDAGLLSNLSNPKDSAPSKFTPPHISYKPILVNSGKQVLERVSHRRITSLNPVSQINKSIINTTRLYERQNKYLKLPYLKPLFNGYRNGRSKMKVFIN